MTTSETFFYGKCGQRNIRVKQWKSGFSIKCVGCKHPKTLVSQPFDEDIYMDDLRQFCVDCEKAEKTKEQK